ncbi:MAG: hypothetical protein KME30_29915 [Iphinoe sp. HA4291-MV1]|jgi:hypothetical protein|nr:hypothetical protein [Iphinoe sp. HA4291-MV1]
MTHFIGNNRVTFDSEKIVIIHWSCKDHNDLTHAEVHLIEGQEVCLYFTSDEEFELINDLRNEFGYEPLPRVR